MKILIASFAWLILSGAMPSAAGGSCTSSRVTVYLMLFILFQVFPVRYFSLFLVESSFFLGGYPGYATKADPDHWQQHQT